MEIAKIKQLYLQGMGCLAISKTCNIPVGRISWRLRKLGLLDSKRPCKSKFGEDDLIKIGEMYKQRICISKIAVKFNCSKQAIFYRLKSLGISGEYGNKPLLPKVSLELLKSIGEEYQAGFGILKLSKIYGLTSYHLTKELKRLDLLDSSRKTKRRGFSVYIKRSGKEFTNEVKRSVFLDKMGICEFCKCQIGDGINWRDWNSGKKNRNKEVCYHHKLSIELGGTGIKENCVVLHKVCHVKNHYELHRAVYLKRTT